jgi:hypothetical protein
MSDKTIDTKGRLHSCWSQFQEIAENENRPGLVQRIEPEMKRFELGLFRLVVMGEIKKGKTSFVNALLGVPDLLPVASDIATSVVYKVIYGQERKFKVFFRPDNDTGKRRDPLEIKQIEIAAYGTEDGNPGNEKQVDFIGVEEPNPLLKEGIVLIDTPGVGGMFKIHREISWRYAPNADAIFFVLDSVEAVMSRDEVAFLMELKDRLKKQVFFVQTKIDAVDSEQGEAWQTRNRKILQDEVGITKDQIRYFPISSELKKNADELHDGELLQESGFLTLLDFIHRGLKAKKDEMLATQVAVNLALPMNEIFSHLQSQQRMLQTKTGEEIETIRKDLEKTKVDFAQWEHDIYQPEIRNFPVEFENIRKKYRRLIQEAMDPNGSIVMQTINEFRESKFNPKEAVALSEEIQQVWLSNVMEMFGRIQEEYNNDVIALSNRTAINLQHTTDATALLPYMDQTAGPMVSTERIAMSFNRWNESKTVMYGSMAGSMMAGVPIYLASVVFPPAALLGVLALFVGGWLTKKEIVIKQREEFLAKLKLQLQTLASQILRYAMNHFDDLGSSYERKISEFFRETVEQHRKRLEEQSEQARQTMNRSREENTKIVEDVKRRMTKVENLLRQLKTLLPEKSRS